ncbi:hypothetical protein [Rhodoblastus sp.]|uniref:hypothetical protein n=1 Tax=Rhodoblastus sp. TaxID=1962975 RepID=UPI003F9D04CB
MYKAKNHPTPHERKLIEETYGDNWSHGDYFLVGVKLEQTKHGRPRAIDFCPVPTKKAPDTYVALMLRFDQTLSVLRTLFPEEDAPSVKKFDEYFGRLAELARTALGQDQPHLGVLGLQTFQDEVVMREGGRIKNNYAVKLGLLAAVFGALATVVFLLSKTSYLNLKDAITYPNLFLMLLGCFLGTWLSFSIRKPVLTFPELAVPEEDQLHPAVRLLFVAGLTVVVFLLLATDVVKVTIGSFDTGALLGSSGGMKAILIGCFCGIGEKALPRVLSKRSDQFVVAIGGHSEKDEGGGDSAKDEGGDSAKEKGASPPGKTGAASSARSEAAVHHGADHREKTEAISTASHAPNAHHHADSHKKS